MPDDAHLPCFTMAQHVIMHVVTDAFDKDEELLNLRIEYDNRQSNSGHQAAEEYAWDVAVGFIRLGRQHSGKRVTNLDMARTALLILLDDHFDREEQMAQLSLEYNKASAEQSLGYAEAYAADFLATFMRTTIDRRSNRARALAARADQK